MTRKADRKPMHLNAFLMSVGHHEAAWRLPESDPHADFDVAHWIRLARIAERGKLDSLFLADGPVMAGAHQEGVEVQLASWSGHGCVSVVVRSSTAVIMWTYLIDKQGLVPERAPAS